jgi:hypothetical protein
MPETDWLTHTWTLPHVALNSIDTHAWRRAIRWKIELDFIYLQGNICCTDIAWPRTVSVHIHLYSMAREWVSACRVRSVRCFVFTCLIGEICMCVCVERGRAGEGIVWGKGPVCHLRERCLCQQSSSARQRQRADQRLRTAVAHVRPWLCQSVQKQHAAASRRDGHLDWLIHVWTEICKMNLTTWFHALRMRLLDCMGRQSIYPINSKISRSIYYGKLVTAGDKV